MLIVGAKGFAKEVLEVLYQLNDIENVVFYDDVSEDLPKQLYERFDILRNAEEVKKYFQNVDNRFTIGIGGPVLRKKMFDKFTALGGVFTSTISPKANIGHFGNEIEDADLKNYLLQNNVRKHLEKFQKTGLNPDELLEKYINEIISEFKVIAIQTKDTIFENDILQKNSEKYMTLPFITQDIQKN